MSDETSLVEHTHSASGRSLAILVDALAPGEDGDIFGEGTEGAFLLRLASLLASASGGRVMLFGVLQVPEGESTSSFSMQAQALRRELETAALAALSAGTGATQQTSHMGHSLISPIVRVAPENDLSGEVRRFLESERGALLLLPLPKGKGIQQAWLRKALRNPLPCDVGWARPPVIPEQNASSTAPFEVGMRVLLPARGGPQAQLAFDLSQDLMSVLRAQVTVLHVLQEMPEMMRASEEAPFEQLLDQFDAPGRTDAGMPMRAFGIGNDPVKSISDAAADYNLIIMGAGGQAAADVGKFTQGVARGSRSALLAIKTRVPVGPAIRAARKRARLYAPSTETLSALVDKWFAENTFHANEFTDLARLIDIKHQRGATISVGLPALNEEATIGGVISVLKEALMEQVPLVDEIVLIDSNSTDRTREIAADLGIPVYIHSDILPEAGPPLVGKGEALWKSLHVLKGDIIAWVDTDVANMHPQFVYGLIGPLLREPRVGFVKGYYHRPLRISDELQHEGGGRVTELTVRPLLNLFFPLLSGLVQPLAGEYAGRREVLEQIPFFSGYGVETGMLIDLLERNGLYSIGQVNLEKRIHRNRSLADLSLTAFAIVQVILLRLESRARTRLLEEVNQSMKLIRFEQEHLSLEVRSVRDVERPPIVSIPAYRSVSRKP